MTMKQMSEFMIRGNLYEYRYASGSDVIPRIPIKLNLQNVAEKIKPP